MSVSLSVKSDRVNFSFSEPENTDSNNTAKKEQEGERAAEGVRTKRSKWRLLPSGRHPKSNVVRAPSPVLTWTVTLQPLYTPECPPRITNDPLRPRGRHLGHLVTTVGIAVLAVRATGVTTGTSGGIKKDVFRRYTTEYLCCLWELCGGEGGGWVSVLNVSYRLTFVVSV